MSHYWDVTWESWRLKSLATWPLNAQLNTSRPRQNGCHFPNDIFKLIFLNENVWVLIKIPLKFVPMGPIKNIPALDQIMAWRRPGDKPLSQPMMVSLLTHICVTRPQWINQHQRKHQSSALLARFQMKPKILRSVFSHVKFYKWCGRYELTLTSP